MSATSGTPGFHITDTEPPAETVVAGFSAFGLAGLTAVDYLVDHLDLAETGFVTADGLPTVTPFEDGRPRHHSRLFSRPDLEVTVLVGELFLPVRAARPFADALCDWAAERDVVEVVALSGVPYAHGPDEHAAFYVADDDYRERRLSGDSVAPMGRGFLDGVEGAITARGLGSDLRTAVFVTPVHDRTPDVPAAVRLVEAFDRVYDLGLDADPLEAYAGAVEQHYRNLAERLPDVDDEATPEDRMYM